MNQPRSRRDAGFEAAPHALELQLTYDDGDVFFEASTARARDIAGRLTSAGESRRRAVGTRFRTRGEERAMGHHRHAAARMGREVRAPRLVSPAGWMTALPVFEPHWQVTMAHGLASGMDRNRRRARGV